jgi:nucleoside-diphosphate-sugar epimerase
VRLAIAGAAGPLGQALTAALGGEHDLLLAGGGDGRPSPAGGAVLEGDLRDPEVARRLVAGQGALLYLAAHPDAWPAGRPDEETLDTCARGTFLVLRAAALAGVPRVVLISTLDLFEAYPPGWAVDETWRPRPGTALPELGPYVGELSAREIARAGWPLSVVCLRLARIGGTSGGSPDPRALHVADAVQAVRRALAFRPGSAARRGPSGPEAQGWVTPPDRGWWVFHIPGGRRARFPLRAAGETDFGYAPQHQLDGACPPEARPAYVDETGTLTPARARPRRAGGGERPPRLTLFGGSGPLASAVAPLLAPAYALRLTDVLTPEDGAARIASRWPDAPRPARWGAPHEFRAVDVADGAAVQDAVAGADAVLNCTVVREEVSGAFRVNTLGAYNVLRAALKEGVRRVVHTGPQILSLDHPAGYGADFDVPADAPFRAGANVYFHSKYLGLEITRVFATNHGLEVAALLFSTFVDPEEPAPRRERLGPAAISWADAGTALRRAVELPALPSSFELLRILGDLPQGKFSNRKARRVLDWAPRDSLRHLWQTPDA